MTATTASLAMKLDEILEEAAATAMAKASENYDFGSDIEEALGNYNFDKAIEGAAEGFDFDPAIDEAVRNFDFDEAIKKAVDLDELAGEAFERVAEKKLPSVIEATFWKMLDAPGFSERLVKALFDRAAS